MKNQKRIKFVVNNWIKLFEEKDYCATDDELERKNRRNMESLLRALEEFDFDYDDDYSSIDDCYFALGKNINNISKIGSIVYSRLKFLYGPFGALDFKNSENKGFFLLAFSRMKLLSNKKIDYGDIKNIRIKSFCPVPKEEKIFPLDEEEYLVQEIDLSLEGVSNLKKYNLIKKNNQKKNVTIDKFQLDKGAANNVFLNIGRFFIKKYGAYPDEEKSDSYCEKWSIEIVCSDGTCQSYDGSSDHAARYDDLVKFSNKIRKILGNDNLYVFDFR